MGKHTPPPYKRLNRQTGLWEWVRPKSEEYSKKDVMRPLLILNNKTIEKERKKYK